MKFHHFRPPLENFYVYLWKNPRIFPLEEILPTPMITFTKCQMSADANNYDSQNVECQSLIPRGKFSSGSARFTEWTITNLSDVYGISCIQQPVPACGLTHGCVTMLSESQDCELSYFGLVLQLRHIGRESSIHSACNCASF